MAQTHLYTVQALDHVLTTMRHLSLRLASLTADAQIQLNLLTTDTVNNEIANHKAAPSCPKKPTP